MAITAAQVKELREITGIGMMECKKALTETDGDIQAAIDELIRELKSNLPSNLIYHGYQHTLDVLQSVAEISQNVELEEEEVELLRTAAVYHDSGFLTDYAEHEKESCELAQKRLPDFGYSQDQINVVKGMIMATRIPQNPTNLLERILCDADLDYLGGGSYFEISNSTF